MNTDPHFLLTLHQEHLAGLRAEAAADRLARVVRAASGAEERGRHGGRPSRGGFGRRRRRGDVACSTS